MTSVPAQFWIHGRMPGMNDIIAAAKKSGRASAGGRRWNAYNSVKQTWTEIVARAAGNIGPVKRAKLVFVWFETGMRRDPDNVAGGGRKLILDGLKLAGVIRDDSGKYVAGWEDRFVWNSSEPGVMVEVYEEDDV